MLLTKLGHSCFRVESGGTTLVIDPGGFSDPEALQGANAVLITHEHADHVVPERLAEALRADPDLAVWTNEALAAQLGDDSDFGGLATRITVVGHGDTFTVGPDVGGPEAGSLEISVHGQRHARIHADIPLIANVGFMLPGAIFHPGDALTVPEMQVDTLLAPAAAPWLKISELIDWLRTVAPERAYLIHDAILSEVGLGLVQRVAGQLSPVALSRVTNGEPFEA
jgi:L-ascorbate metabolism protein UlaG (beta-lactamase superfamily)